MTALAILRYGAGRGSLSEGLWITTNKRQSVGFVDGGQDARTATTKLVTLDLGDRGTAQEEEKGGRRQKQQHEKYVLKAYSI